MSWKTVIIKNGNKTSLYLNNLLINTNDENIKIPLDDIYSIVFENFKTSISVRLLATLAKYKILVSFCDEKLIPVAISLPINGYYKQLEVVHKQQLWTREHKLIIWTNIVKSKIENQIEVLKMNLKDIDKSLLLEKYTKEIELGDITNREAHAAKVYFNELFGKNFKRDGLNHINSALNFGYTIIRSAFIRSIVAKGLLPSISIFHHNMYDGFALADDLMEPFRPIVDDYVYKNIMYSDYFDREHKVQLINLVNTKIEFLNKKMYLTNAIDKYVEKIIQKFETESFFDFEYPVASSVEYYEY